MTLDAVSVEVIGNRLISIVNEQQAALVRTAFSTIVRESEDLACGVFDPRGWMVAQSLTGTPGHINAMATGMRHVVEAYPEERLEPGDVLVTNDPWQTSGQINDFTVATPVFHGGPVQTERGFVLHEPLTDESGDSPYNSSLRIAGGLEMTTSKDVLEAISSGAGPKKVLVTLGYSGWGAGQLEEEMSRNGWINVDAEPGIIFDTPVSQRYGKALSLLGIDARMLSQEAGHA